MYIYQYKYINISTYTSCFAGTTVQILTRTLGKARMVEARARFVLPIAGAQFTCFTSTKGGEGQVRVTYGNKAAEAEAVLDRALGVAERIYPPVNERC
jgi:hypothetical protein